MYDPARDSWKQEDDPSAQSQTPVKEPVETKTVEEEIKPQDFKASEKSESTPVPAQKKEESKSLENASHSRPDPAELQQQKEFLPEPKPAAEQPPQQQDTPKETADSNMKAEKQVGQKDEKSKQENTDIPKPKEAEAPSSQAQVDAPKKESKPASTEESGSTLADFSKDTLSGAEHTNGRREAGPFQDDSATQEPPRKIRKPNSRMSQQERDDRSREQRERLERRERNDRRYDDRRNDDRRYDDRRYDDRRHDDPRHDDRRNDHYRRYDDRRDDRHYDDRRYDDRRSNEGSNNGAFNYGPSDSDRSIVRNHYNQRPDQGIHRRRDSPIIKLRTFNNWVKAVLINKFTRRGNVVLDIGCGKGGDLLKWGKEGCAGFIGIDVADVSVSQAKHRYNQVRDKTFWADFRVGDAFEQNVEDIVQPEAFPVDIVSSQFCLHYAFESESRVRKVLSNITRALKPGGTFIGTIPNSDVINKHIRKLGPTELKWGNSIYSVEFENPPPRDGIFNPIYGHKYRFFLEDAVGNIPEYVVPFDAFKKLAEEDFGLELIYKKSFLRMFDEELENRNRFFLRKAENMGMYKNDGTLGIEGDEREACGFYLAFAFIKR
jgi:mRNA (guanine-N7-)-methyltransferase